jgi:NAD(P)-dependent dehydrogenase (short-subunit alcohol dehydrogenase family)
MSSRVVNREFDLRGKVILVTGAAGLIGREICDAFAAYGADLVVTDRGADAVAIQTAALRNAAGVRAVGVAADVTSSDDVAELFTIVEHEFGRLDVLVNLAAIDAKFDAAVSAVNPTRFENFPLELWEKSVAVNATGLVRVTQAAARMMLARRAGNIINVASTYSVVAPNQDLYRYPGEASQTYKPVDYVGTKSMVPNFTRYLATLYGRDGIRANCVVPHGVANDHPEKFRQNFARLSPLGRMCRPDELRGPFVFLASDASSYMTGATLVVDGGWTAW